MNGVNLIPASLLDLRRRRARARLWTFATAGYATLLVGVYTAFASGGSHTDAARRIGQVAVQTEQERAELKVLREKAAEAQREADAARIMGNHPDWSVLLGLLARRLSADLTIDSCELVKFGLASAPPAAAVPAVPTAPAAAPGKPAPEGFKVVVGGLARTQSAITSYALELENVATDGEKLFQSVAILEAKTRRFESTDIVVFKLECVLAGQRAQPKKEAR